METKFAIGIYYVIGYGSDCDGYSAFKCVAFVDEKKAISYCDDCNEWSDGVRYSITSDMRVVLDYCDNWMRSIPFAIVDEDTQIIREYTYINQ
jgi:hypothetical protein